MLFLLLLSHNFLQFLELNEISASIIAEDVLLSLGKKAPDNNKNKKYHLGVVSSVSVLV